MSIADRFHHVMRSIEAAAARSGRVPGEITLVAVSKKKSVGEMRAYRDAALERGIPVVFGENYVQELVAKREELGADACIHMMGPLQSNKVRAAVASSDVIESVHSEKVIDLIAKEARARGAKQAIFLQVNIGNDPMKSGFQAEAIASVVEKVARLSDAIELHGLMTITPYYEIAEDARADFVRMAELRASLQSAGLDKHFVDQRIRLSMGMSSDFEVAIEEGADLVRVGTAIFGER